MNLQQLLGKISSSDDETQLIESVLKEYNLNELLTFDDNFLGEDAANAKSFSTKNWDVDYSNAYKKGLKKHRNNPKVAKEVKELEQWIISHEKRPQTTEFPPKFNVHIIKKDPKFSGAYDAHIIGSQIIALFYIEDDKGSTKLRWIYIGSHSSAKGNLGS